MTSSSVLDRVVASNLSTMNWTWDTKKATARMYDCSTVAWLECTKTIVHMY